MFKQYAYAQAVVDRRQPFGPGAVRFRTARSSSTSGSGWDWTATSAYRAGHKADDARMMAGGAIAEGEAPVNDIVVLVGPVVIRRAAGWQAVPGMADAWTRRAR